MKSNENSPRSPRGDNIDKMKGGAFINNMTAALKASRDNSPRAEVLPIEDLKSRPKCYACALPVASENLYPVKQIRVMEAFLNMNPQWLTFGKEFNNDTILCDKSNCLAAAFENWRLDSFGVKSPRGLSPPGHNKSPRLGIKPTPQPPAIAIPAVNDSDSVASVSNEVGEPETIINPSDILKRTDDGSSMSSSSSSSSIKVVIDHEAERIRFLDIVEEKRQKVAMLTNKGASMNSAADNISQEINANRDERLRVAKRLQELRSKQPEIEIKKIAREKEYILTRKREIYERLLQARVEHAAVQAKTFVLQACL